MVLLVKRCNKCGTEKALEAFAREKAAPDGRRYTCKECENTQRRERASVNATPRSVDDCEKPRRGYARYCPMHAARLRRGGDVGPAGLLRQPIGTPYLTSDGYRAVKGQYVHRLVMASAIGRDLLPHETVHHKNGNRDDNALSNLELWSSWQPPGQRIVDKVAWAKALLALYEPEALSFRQDSQPLSRPALST